MTRARGGAKARNAYAPDRASDFLPRDLRAPFVPEAAPCLLHERGMRCRNDRGFGLLEVLLVIAIIAVLAAIALPHYWDTRARSLDAKLESAVRHVATGEEAYYANRQHYTTAVDDLDGIIVVGGTVITIEDGNSGDIGTSFRVRGTAPGVGHAYVWVSDPGPGEPNLFRD